MGANQSSSLLDVVNSATAEVITNNMQNCSASNTQTMVYAPTNSWFAGVSASQSSNLSQTCIAEFQVTNDIIDQITNNIIQKASAESPAVLDFLHANSADVQAHVKNIVNSTVTTSFVQSSVAGVMQSMAIGGSGSVTVGASFSQSADTVQKSIMTSLSNTNFSTSIVNALGQTASAKQTNPLDFISNSIFYIVMLIIVIILAIVGIVVYALT